MTSTCGIDKETLKRARTEHPYTIAICGYSGSGKTTLIEKLIKRFGNRLGYRVGYHKHDGHQFEMDKEGKDTWKASSAGAKDVWINSSEKFAYQSFEPFSLYNEGGRFLDSDILLVEGYKNSSLPKILVLDEQGVMLQEWKKGQFENVLGVCSSAKLRDAVTEDSILDRDDVETIQTLILSSFQKKIKQTPMYGLVLTGGKSSRMGKDKSLLKYTGEEQWKTQVKQLERFCDTVFVSINGQSTKKSDFPEQECIEDSFLEMGPLSGILSAQKEYPLASFCVVACDLPLLSKETVQQLMESRNPYKYATAFCHGDSYFPEPLCAIYESKFYRRSLQFVGMGYHCPRKVLINSEIEKVDPQYVEDLHNANTPQDFEKCMAILNNRKGM